MAYDERLARIRVALASVESVTERKMFGGVSDDSADHVPSQPKLYEKPGSGLPVVFVHGTTGRARRHEQVGLPPAQTKKEMR